jgi:thiosulfate dehydrogenase [quinone] large subunit
MENQPVSKADYGMVAVRVTLGLTFLWAFLDKLFGLRYSTMPANSWLKGGHPTKGYLSSAWGPLAGMFHKMAGNGLVDALFMIGLLCVGVTMLFGIATRLGAWGGFAMVLLMYASHPIVLGHWYKQPDTSHPFLDDHILEAAAFLWLAFVAAGDVCGMGKWWRANVKATWLQ